MSSAHINIYVLLYILNIFNRYTFILFELRLKVNETCFINLFLSKIVQPNIGFVSICLLWMRNFISIQRSLNLECYFPIIKLCLPFNNWNSLTVIANRICCGENTNWHAISQSIFFSIVLSGAWFGANIKGEF